MTSEPSPDRINDQTAGEINKALKITDRRSSSTAIDKDQDEAKAGARKTARKMPQKPVAIPHETLDTITRKIQG